MFKVFICNFFKPCYFLKEIISKFTLLIIISIASKGQVWELIFFNSYLILLYYIWVLIIETCNIDLLSLLLLLCIMKWDCLYIKSYCSMYWTIYFLKIYLLEIEVDVSQLQDVHKGLLCLFQNTFNIFQVCFPFQHYHIIMRPLTY